VQNNIRTKSDWIWTARYLTTKSSLIPSTLKFGRCCYSSDLDLRS